MKNKSVDMINGSVFKNMLAFALPLLATNVLAQLFNVADLIVVGRFCGSDCVAAIGATSSLVALIVNFFIGVSVGSGIVVAQCYGSGKKRDIEKSVHTVIPSAIVIGAFLTVAGLLLAKKLLLLMGTPNDIINQSALYLRIYFCGIILRMAYVFCAAVLRAVGDSKSPLIYLSLGGALNVVFNLFFVLVCGMSVDGVAYGTVISEGISGVLCFVAIFRRTDAAKFRFSKIRSCFDLKMLKRIITIGVPSGIQSSLYAISNVLVQSGVNSFGKTVVAGVAAATNIGTFTSVTASAFGSAASNFIGQNFGAKKFDRIRKIPYVTMVYMMLFTLTLAITTRIFAPQLLGLYITDNPAAIKIGVLRISIVTMSYCVCGIMEIYTGGLRAVGKPILSTVTCLFSCCALRVIYLYTLFKLDFFHTPAGIFAVYPVTWFLTGVALSIMFVRTVKQSESVYKFKKQQNND